MDTALVKRKPQFIVAAFGALLLAVFVAVWFATRRELPRISLRDGSEFRVLQVTYTARPSDDIDHNLHAPKLRWWLYRHMPRSWQRKIEQPNRGIGIGTSSDHPVLSIWWAHFDSEGHPPMEGRASGALKPMLGEAGDVWMTVDSGEKTNLGWPDPGDDFRQIFVTDPPTTSKRLTFEFPIWGEPVHFSIDNPAYRGR